MTHDRDIPNERSYCQSKYTETCPICEERFTEDEWDNYSRKMPDGEVVCENCFAEYAYDCDEYDFRIRERG